MSEKDIVRWADSAMYTAEPIDAEAGPKVYLLWMTPDPLGAVAAACKIYKGEVVRSLSDVTDAERDEYFKEVQKTHLKAPLEFVKFHFMIEGVTRAFTHQMVRQRTAVYAQESLRFAVKEDLPMGLPASLAGSTGEMMKIRWEVIQKYGQLVRYETNPADHAEQPRDFHPSWVEWHGRTAGLSDLERKRYRWDLKVERIREDYLALIDDGMPAEDARGLLPHNVLTRLHYSTDLRALLEHSGNRLCTQAQFEWRLVFSRIAEVIRNHDPYQGLIRDYPGADQEESPGARERWQFNEIAGMFRPICYQTGKCEFKANFDRPCSIRERVDMNELMGRSSSEWHKSGPVMVAPGGAKYDSVQPIQPAEWLLDSGAAR